MGHWLVQNIQIDCYRQYIPGTLTTGSGFAVSSFIYYTKGNLSHGVHTYYLERVQGWSSLQSSAECYAKAKSYRPISLTSFLLKVLKEIIDKHLRDCLLAKLPFTREYVYQTGKSSEQTIHDLTRRVEIAFSNKEIAPGTFLGIEDPFGRASSERGGWILKWCIDCTRKS